MALTLVPQKQHLQSLKLQYSRTMASLSVDAKDQQHKEESKESKMIQVSNDQEDHKAAAAADEENKVLRKEMEKNLQDYNHLQMKLALIQQNNPMKDPRIFLSLLNGNEGLVQEQQQGIERDLNTVNNPRHGSPSAGDSDDKDGHGLGLSLTLKTRTSQREIREEERNKKLKKPRMMNRCRRSFHLQSQAMLFPHPTGKLGFPLEQDVKQLQYVQYNMYVETSSKLKIASGTIFADERWVSMEEICPEICKRKSLPTSLLSLHGSSRMPGQETRTHNHPIPVGATAMASTASSSALPASNFMLLVSSHGIPNPHLMNSSAAAMNVNDPSKGMVLSLTNNHRFDNQILPSVPLAHQQAFPRLPSR
ncbi:hypothetical protein F3Y22_tig00005712pilonHSYRG00017 [Hibiscus syriacus]|uniref:Uncharacterized protein n=1 Tax=Hibiscus syriacus TaxID=106335 RepID=A0A6A3CIU1_HIBSY|nr:hypothetical protein F3Y22_tig00005712pilonHSYRG00017 [Hibiscus syriacus]